MAIFLLLTHNQFSAEIKDTLGKISDSTFNLIIYTDIHHDRNHIDPVDPYIPTLDNVAQLCKRARIDSIWNLGDIINGFSTTKAEAIAEIQDVVMYEDKISPNVHRVIGNHDNNIQSASIYPVDEVLMPTELNALLENKGSDQREHHSSTIPTDYYVDFPDLRVVCISADVTTFRTETAEWLRSIALDTDLPVLFLSHIPTRPEWGFHNDVENGELIEAAIEEFINDGGTVICFIHGHDHGDMVNTVDALYTEVAVGCTRFHVPKSNGTPGMKFWERDEHDETMLLFDVVSIDLEGRTVRFTRFGAGEDREIKY